MTTVLPALGVVYRDRANPLQVAVVTKTAGSNCVATTIRGIEVMSVDRFFDQFIHPDIYEPGGSE